MKAAIHDRVEIYKAITESGSIYILECNEHNGGLTCMIESKKDGGFFQAVDFTDHQPVSSYIQHLPLAFIPRKKIAVGKHICGRNKAGKIMYTSRIKILAKKVGWLRWARINSAE